MALKVVPAGDERCDIHNGRRPAAYICKDCLRELGVEGGQAVTVRRGPIRGARRLLRRRPVRRARRVLRRAPLGRRGALIAAALLAIAIAVVVVIAATGGGGESPSGSPTEAEVVEALELSPNPDGTGWITLDGACAVLSIQIGAPPPAPTANPTIATNESGTVRAVVLESFSQNQAACVNRISAGLREHF
jgi:hypothetical protein